MEVQGLYLIVGGRGDRHEVVFARAGVVPLDVYVEEGEDIDTWYERQADRL